MIFLRRIFRRPPIQMGMIDDSRSRKTSIRNSQFVSFFSATDCSRRRHVDHHDVRLRRQKWTKAAVMLIVAAGVTWIAVESAHALSSF